MTANDDIVQVRRRPGFSGDVTATLYTGETVTWCVGECIPMRRAEAEQRDDAEIVMPEMSDPSKVQEE